MEGSESADEQSKSVSKPAVVRNARACTVCRAAKMKCVGAEDGQKPCQRCKRTNVECIFEKHRRGRKPGSKLSEASKMLRRLEKGLNAAKLKQMNETSTSPVYSTVDSRSPQGDSPFSGMLHPTDQYGSSGSRPSDGDEEEDGDRGDERFPAKMIRRENSFFRTILNPEPKSPYHTTILPQAPRGDPEHHQPRPSSLPDGYEDPISAGLVSEDKARILLDLIMLRLNPFINLFDPALHSLDYVRSRCPFLFTTLIMAGCKFFEPSLYKDCLRLAHEFAVHAFSKAWKRVEVVQAFACLTYWREQEDNVSCASILPAGVSCTSLQRTWMYIGFACRMAVELGLNRFVTKPPPNETEFQLLERRNRERTYLVLFVHDRSLSMQTGRHWMLPEDDFIRHSDTWHLPSGNSTRCGDVVVAAFAQLRRVAAETTDMLHTNRSLVDGGNRQANVDMALKNANAKLAQWSAKWEGEMRKANGEPFHFSFLSFFRLYTSLFLNSFGVQDHVPQASRTNSHLRALLACFDNALNVLHIASKEFRDLAILQYGQETTSVMTAYSAIFLLRV
ncbi:fungal-specific transcription factor domain-containing protein [Scleroderma citrinum]